MKFCITLLMIAMMVMTTASLPPPKKTQLGSTTETPMTNVTISPLNIITVPEFPCPRGQQRDINGKCRLFLQNLKK
ncbi:uncharacterized protein [Mycetomoellerius zeteki]|uniref:uncharacterized protein n=1 Tax=Mycetomoellerius zeteki TaxID=64791 RepID=UPI00084E4D15|nr:PREDICTED: uncharacterized protein LOC108726477 [Trachymyrmex zeteki]